MTFASIFLSEAKRLLSNISVLFVCIAGPLAYFFLYPSPYQNDVIKTQKIAIIDNDNTHLSRELTFYADASPDITITKNATSLENAKSLLEKGEIFGILYIPNGFEKDAYLQTQPTLGFLANSSYFLIYGSIVNALHNATEALNPIIQEKQRLMFGSYNPQNLTPLKQKNLLTLHSTPLFNPSLGYINYALAAVFVVILHQMLIVGMGIFGASYTDRIYPLQLVLARVILFSTLCIPLFTFYFGFGFDFYGINHHASIGDFWRVCLAFIFSLVCFGVFFGTLIPQPHQATQIILISSLPLVFLIGFIWPTFSIPLPINFFTQFIPLFHGVNAMLRLNEMGASFYEVFPYVRHLLVLGIFYFVLAIAVLWIKKLSNPQNFALKK